MRKPRSLHDLLLDIVKWGDMLNSHISGYDEQRFREDLKTLHAVTRCIEVLGEASSRIMKEHAAFVKSHPDIAFGRAYVTRNRLAHGYDDLDEQLIWRTATESVPLLVAGVRAIVDEPGTPR